jgi:tetratricopeptide (TPR) repeat protein
MSAALLMAALLAPGGTGALAEVSSAELARQAEEEFAEGVRLRHNRDQARPRFRAAAERFEELRRRGARNARLYRNLGNSLFLAGDLPGAILAYRRGLRLAPGDRALRENLTKAREKVVYPPGSNLGRPPADRPPWLPALGPGWLFWGAVLLYCLAWGLLARWLTRRRGRALSLSLGSLLAAGLLALLLARGAPAERGAVVVMADDEVLLRKGDGLTYPPRYQAPLNKGVEARLLHRRGGWLQIELSGGEVGWVPAAYALVDEEGR